MGVLTVRDRHCSVQFPYDIHLLLELTDAMTSPLIFLLLVVGAYHTGRFVWKVILPFLAQRAQATWARATARWARDMPRAAPPEPTIRTTPRRDRRPPVPRDRTPSPRPRQDRSPVPPGSLAILTPAKNPPAALIEALNRYQAQADQERPREANRSPRARPSRPSE